MGRQRLLYGGIHRSSGESSNKGKGKKGLGILGYKDEDYMGYNNISDVRVCGRRAVYLYT